jgi:hypothetical protein
MPNWTKKMKIDRGRTAERILTAEARSVAEEVAIGDVAKNHK